MLTRTHLAAAMLAALSCSVLAQPVAPGPAPAAPPVPRTPPAPAAVMPAPLLAPGESTRLQVDVYQLELAAENLRTLDLAELGKGTPTRADVLRRLDAAGKASLVMRFDTTLDLRTETSMTNGRRVPVTQDITVTKEGKRTPGVTYSEIGAILKVSGNWREAPAKSVADVKFTFELTSVSRTSVKLDEGLALPSFNTLKIQQRLVLEDGKPVYLMSNVLPEPDDDQGKTVVTILGVSVNRTAPIAEAQSRNFDNIGGSPQALIRAEIIEVRDIEERLSAEEIEDRIPKGASLEEGLQTLNKLGKPEIVARPKLLVNWPQEAEIAIGHKVPKKVDEKATPRQQPEYEEIGTRMRIVGHWLSAADPTRAVLIMNVRQRTLEESATISTGPTYPTICTRQWERAVFVDAGQPVWLTADGARLFNSDAGRPPKTSLTLVRLVVDRPS